MQERFLSEYVAASSLREVHCYHPQPYYDPAEFHQRLITPAFLALLHSRLEPGGSLFIQTDHPGYWEYMRSVIPQFFKFTEQPGPWPDAPKGRTRREIIALRRGLPVFRGVGTRKDSLQLDEISDLVKSLPSPTFDADRRLWELDELERAQSK